MEKRKPHYPLSMVKDRILKGNFRVTRTALQCAARDFGLLDSAQVAEWVLSLERRDFYKSMTTIHDATHWQDVYRPLVNDVPAYVKVQIADDATIVISFKISEDAFNA